jgi:hypothetical protein
MHLQSSGLKVNRANLHQNAHRRHTNRQGKRSRWQPDLDAGRIIERGRKLLATRSPLRLFDAADIDLAEIWVHIATGASEAVAWTDQFLAECKTFGFPGRYDRNGSTATVPSRTAARRDLP